MNKVKQVLSLIILIGLPFNVLAKGLENERTHKTSENFQSFLSKLPKLEFPIDFQSLVKKYYVINEIECTDTTFQIYRDAIGKVILPAYESDFKKIDKQVSQDMSIHNLVNNLSYKIPFSYAAAEDQIILFFFSFATCEDGGSTQFYSTEINAAYYDLEGNQIIIENADCPFIECFSTVTIDMSIINSCTFWESPIKIQEIRKEYFYERDYERLFGDGESYNDLPIISLTIEEKEMQIVNRSLQKKEISNTTQDYY